MKKILAILSLFICLQGASQTQFDHIGGLPLVMNTAVSGCFYYNFDGDLTGINEIKIVHGVNTGCFITSATSTPVYMPTHSVDGVNMWSDCDNSMFFNWTSDTAYIALNGTRLSNGSHVLPLMYNGKVGYFVLRLVPGSDTLLIRGHRFNIAPRDFECYQLYTPTGPGTRSPEYRETNYLGQPVDEFHTGLTIRVYEDGRTERAYR